MDKALTIFLAAIFAVADVNGRTRERTVEHETRMRCLAGVRQCGVQDIVKQADQKLPNSAFLDKNCENFMSALSCSIEKLSECDPEQTTIAEKVLHLAGRLCDAEDPLSKAYRENVACLNENIEIIDRCRKSVYSTLTGFVRHVLNIDPAEIRDEVRTCLTVMVYQACLVGGTEMQCGEETAKLVKVLHGTMEVAFFGEGCTEDEAQEMKEDIIKYITKEAQEPDYQDLIDRVVN